MEWYQSERINDHLTGITDVSGVRCFLVEGRDSALLIDTCTGVGNLKNYVDTLTRKPYQVVLTHGHVDHAGGAGYFDAVYMDPADLDLAKEHTSVARRLNDLKHMAPEYYDAAVAEGAVGDGKPRYLPLHGGMVFSLGGLDVEAVSMPGHTRGMTMMLLIQDRAMLLGDACNSRVFLFGQEACSVQRYRRLLDDLMAMDGRYDTALFSHGPAIQPKSIIRGVMDVADDILAGRDDKAPFEFMGQKALMGKAVGPDNNTRADGGAGNIVYAPDHIRDRRSEMD